MAPRLSLLLLLTTLINDSRVGVDEQEVERSVRSNEKPRMSRGGQPDDDLRNDLFEHHQDHQGDHGAINDDGSSSSSVCTLTAEESTAIGNLMFAPRGTAFGSDFLDYIVAIPELRGFVGAVRAFINDPDISSSMGDEEVLNMAMVPVSNDKSRKLGPPLPSTTMTNDDGQQQQRDENLRQDDDVWLQLLQCCDNEVLVERVAGIIEECFDMSFFLAGVDEDGPVEGIGKAVGQIVAQDLLRGTESARIIARIRSTLQARFKTSTLAMGEIYSFAISEVGMNGILQAISQVPDVSAWHLAVVGLSPLRQI